MFSHSDVSRLLRRHILNTSRHPPMSNVSKRHVGTGTKGIYPLTAMSLQNIITENDCDRKGVVIPWKIVAYQTSTFTDPVGAYFI